MNSVQLLQVMVEIDVAGWLMAATFDNDYDNHYDE